MDYELKYKNALEWARQVMNGETGFIREEVVEAFPELAESMDERIRKALIRFHHSTIELDGIKGEEILAWLEKQGERKIIVTDEQIHWLKWAIRRLPDTEKANEAEAVLTEFVEQLEKQGEQKPVYKVEPKFHEGDWIVYKNDICQIVKREEGCNKLVTIFGIEKELVNERNLSTARLWTIADAKDGDVLASGEVVFIFKTIHGVWLNCHCSAHKDGSFITDSYDLLTDRYFGEVFPATKEQRSILFSKMKEGGYVWDDEKKELGKIEQSELTEFEDAVKDMMNAYRDAIGDNDVTTEEVKKHATYLLSLIPHKSAEWTEEDECYMGECISAIATKDSWSFEEKRKTKHWLKSLKQRMEEQQ